MQNNKSITVREQAKDPKPQKEVTPEEDNSFLRSPEVNKAVDHVIARIRNHYTMIKGRPATPEDVKKHIAEVVEGRV